MRRFRRPDYLLTVVVCACVVVAMLFAASQIALRRRQALPEPVSVPGGDWEIAWINTPTASDTWDEFVTGLKRAEMQVPGLVVDTSEAFPEHTTSVPRVAISRPPQQGKLHFRWYKTGTGVSTADWLAALAQRDPAPIAVIGGWSSDRAIELASILNRQVEWHGDRPLLFITAATVDHVQSNAGSFGIPGEEPQLTDLYPGRMFRFCFTNKQMAEAVTDYLAQDPSLCPGYGSWPGFPCFWGGAAGGWPATIGLAALNGPGPAIFTLQWQDDPFSEDLADYFTEAIDRRFTRCTDRNSFVRPPSAPAFVQRNRIPFSIGGFARTNSGEAEAVREIVRQLRPPGERSVLIIPSVTAPMRRVLLALSERIPGAGRRLVAVTGDGMSVNAVYRDVEFTWPLRSIPIPLVMFSHQNPFGWDDASSPPPPLGYVLDPLSKRGTQSILLYNEMALMLIETMLPESGEVGAKGADELAVRFQTRMPAVFDASGNRLGGSGEHVLVVRPTSRQAAVASPQRADATITAFRRSAKSGWQKVKTVEVRAEGTAEGRPHP